MITIKQNILADIEVSILLFGSIHIAQKGDFILVAKSKLPELIEALQTILKGEQQ